MILAASASNELLDLFTRYNHDLWPLHLVAYTAGVAAVAPAPDLEQVTGRYFANSKPKKSSKRSYDKAAAARLWQVSAELVGLTTAG